ncbi:MAG: hypothetical protein QOI73_3239 [Solirubrobacteraceae bacterium]|jgi:hypothetical protein|nr:hypothetical protein [Solirubrobacteraceae bacterium]
MTDPPQPRPQPQRSPETFRREEAAQRLARQREAVINTQVDLKREAAERRELKAKAAKKDA